LGVPLPNRLRVLGERRELPQRGRKRIFGIFEAHRTLLIERTQNSVTLLNNVQSPVSAQCSVRPFKLLVRSKTVGLRPNKARFFPLKNPLNRRLGGMAPWSPLLLRLCQQLAQTSTLCVLQYCIISVITPLWLLVRQLTRALLAQKPSRETVVHTFFASRVV